MRTVSRRGILQILMRTSNLKGISVKCEMKTVINAVTTRRVFNKLLQKAWLLAALFPRTASACPNTYVASERVSDCDDWGYFVLGIPFDTGNWRFLSACEFCVLGCTSCWNTESSFVTNCDGDIYMDGGYMCCPDDACGCW